MAAVVCRLPCDCRGGVWMWMARASSGAVKARYAVLRPLIGIYQVVTTRLLDHH